MRLLGTSSTTRAHRDDLESDLDNGNVFTESQSSLQSFRKSGYKIKHTPSLRWWQWQLVCLVVWAMACFLLSSTVLLTVSRKTLKGLMFRIALSKWPCERATDTLITTERVVSHDHWPSPAWKLFKKCVYGHTNIHRHTPRHECMHTHTNTHTHSLLYLPSFVNIP